MKDKLDQMQDGLFSYHRKLEKVFWFREYGEVTVGSSVFSYFCLGDEFYLVVFKTKNPSPLLVYNTKLYEWKE
ncbi:MAG: hypothetical protein ACI3XR_02325 [Eubacteriales bacterium]